MQTRNPVGTSCRDSYSPVRESLSLRSDDIPGAKAKSVAVTKNILHYKDRLSGADVGKYQENLQNKQLFNSHEYIFGGELKIGLQRSVAHGKRHYGDHYRSEIAEKGGIKRGDPVENAAQAFDYDRSLNVADIPGTLAGSTKSKTLVNHDLAQKLRRGASVQKERPEQSFNQYRRVVGDSLDRFQQEVSDSMVRDRRSSRNEGIEPRPSSLVQQTALVEPIKREQPKEQTREQPRENASEGNIKQVFNSAALYRNAAGAPTRGRGDSSVEAVSRKGSSQDYTMQYERRESGIQTERKEEPLQRLDDSQYVNGYKSNSGVGSASESIRRKINEQQRVAVGDSSGWRESVLEQAYGKLANKKEDLKKVYTFNIISNQPNSKLLPSNAKLPYRYAIPFDVEQLTSNKRDIISRDNNVEHAHNLLLQHNNLGRDYNQSVPLGRDSYNGPNNLDRTALVGKQVM